MVESILSPRGLAMYGITYQLIVYMPVVLILGLERIHQVTNTIRIANTGWRIRICIREYSDSLYSLAHSINGMRE